VWNVTDRVATAAMIRDLLGRRLIAVTEARHWFAGERSSDEDSLGHFWLHFDGARPLMAHACGEHLLLKFSEPYAAYDMQEYGETRVAPAKPPDLLAEWAGQKLLNAALIQGHGTEPGAGGVQLRFEHGGLVVASLADEWVLARGSIPDELGSYLTIGEWIADDGNGRPSSSSP
jgi:hypothetical protein